MSSLTPPRVPFAESATTLQDDERLAFDADAGQLKLPRLKFPDGTTQKRGARGPSKSIDDFGAYAAGVFQTTGTIADGSNILNVANLTSFIVGTYVAVQGAGTNPGDWLPAKITAIDEASLNLTLDTPAKRAVQGVVTHQDNSPAIQAAIDSFTPADGFAGMLWILSGIYWCNSTIRMRRRGLRVIGESRESTELVFPGGVKGFVFVSAYSPDPDGGAGDNSVLSNVFIAGGGVGWTPSLRLGGDYGYCVNPTTPIGLCYIVTATQGDGLTGTTEPKWPIIECEHVQDNQVTWIAVAAHGITMYTGATIDSVKEYGFGGDGIAIYGDASGRPPSNDDTLRGPPSNADLWEVRRSSFYQNQGFGLHVAGGTANAGNAFSVACGNNNFYGVFDNSDLGNTYTGCLTENNRLGSYKAVSVNGPSLFLNCYAESGQTALITGSSMFISGLLSLDRANQAAYIGNGLYINGTEFLNAKSKRGRRLGVANQSVAMQFLSFVTDDTNDSIEAQEEAPFMSSRDTLSFYNTNGTLIALPFGRSALRTLGLLVNQALQIGQLNFPNIRTHVDPGTLTDKRRWLRGWECRNSSPTSAADAYSTICTRSGRGVPVWQPGHPYRVGDMVHTMSNDGTGFNNLYFTCVSEGTSGTSQPTWSMTAGDGVAPDGPTLKWQMGDRVAPVWTRGTAYANGDLIKPTTWEIGQTMCRCVFAGTSGGAEPQWNPVDAGPTQDGPDDGGVVWVYENDPLQAVALQISFRAVAAVCQALPIVRCCLPPGPALSVPTHACTSIQVLASQPSHRVTRVGSP